MPPPRKPKKAKEQQPEGITRITVKGFKSLAEETSIDIRPLTILAGANSSGKSSIMQPLLMMKQTLEAGYDPGPLLLDGPNVRFAAARQMLSKVVGAARSRALVVGIEDDDAAFANALSSTDGRDVYLAQATYRVIGQPVTFLPEMAHEAVVAALPAHLRVFHTDVRDRKTGRPARYHIERDGPFLVPSLGEDRSLGVELGDILVRRKRLEERIRETIHLPGLRGNPERAYTTAGVGTMFPGTFEHYTASLILHWQEQDPTRAGEVGQHLADLDLGWKVHAQKVSGAQIELRVARLSRGVPGGARDLVNIADVGFGVSQVLPVVVALLAARPSQLLYIEQPEIHLHPRAQVALAQLLVDAAERGVRVVAETHSSLLLLGVRTLLAEGKLDPGLVKLHWFERGADGVTKVTSGDIDDTGAWNDWPEDFADVTLDAQARYLEAAETKLLGQCAHG